MLFLSIAIMSSLLIAGCGDQRVLEKLGFTHTTSYDLIPKEKGQTEDNLMVAVSIPKAIPEGGKIKRETITAVAATSKEARIKLSRQTELIMVSGQMRNTLFGSSLAKKGLWEHIDTLVRDPAVSQRIKITVVNGNAHNLLLKDFPSHPRTGKYIDQMLEKEANAQSVPQITIFEFTRDLFDDGIDPVAPIVKDLGDHVSLDGIALFDEDRYITKVEADNTIIFAFLRGNLKQGNLDIDLSRMGRAHEHVMLSSLVSKRKVKVSYNQDKKQFKVNIGLNIKGSILEYIGELKISEDSQRHELERIISKIITMDVGALVTKMQKNNVDSIGIGKYVRNSMSYQQWTNLDWKAVYPNVEVDCHAEIKMKDYGKFEK
jgi:spore germination protein